MYGLVRDCFDRSGTQPVEFGVEHGIFPHGIGGHGKLDHAGAGEAAGIVAHVLAGTERQPVIVGA